MRTGIYKTCILYQLKTKISQWGTCSYYFSSYVLKLHKPYLFLILSILKIIFKIKNCFYLKIIYWNLAEGYKQSTVSHACMCVFFSVWDISTGMGSSFNAVHWWWLHIWGLHFLSIVVYWDLGLCSWICLINFNILILCLLLTNNDYNPMDNPKSWRKGRCQTLWVLI